MFTLSSLLKKSLVRGTKLSFYQLQTASAADAKLKHVRHLLLVVQADLLIYAAEVIVYLQPSLSTIYVSKVDSTGCHAPSRAIVSEITVAFLQYLIELYHGTVRLTLFARSQPQYIFPCSSQNKNKHILDDKKLVRWWIKSYDRVRQSLLATREAHGYILIPGFEKLETQRYLPNKDHWTIGHPYDSKACVEQQILSFPDDPKARFLDQLKVERRLQSTTVSEFWEQMAYRQEMSLGHTIGFLTMDVQPSPSDCVLKNDQLFSVDNKSFQSILSTVQNETYSSASETKAATHQVLRVLYDIPSIGAVEVIGEKPVSCEAELSGSSSTKRLQESDSNKPVNILQPRKKTKKTP